VKTKGLLATVTLALASATPAAGDMIDYSGVKPWEHCALCHSLDGVSRMARFPKLAGQVPAYIEKQLMDFRAGRRTNDGDQMQASAVVIEEKDIPLVARYFGGLPPPPPAEAPAPAALNAAKALAESGDAGRDLPACLTCHGRDAAAAAGAPRIEAQHADYIAKQLRDFRSGERDNDPAKVMAGVAAKLSADEIAALAGYFASQERR